MNNKKKYVITGATSGIGKTLAEAFCKENVVFAAYRNEKYVEELENLGAIPFYIDMEKPQTIELAADFIKSKTEKIDTLINAAGCVVAGVVENLDMSEIRKQFEVNTFSHLNFTQRLLPLLNNAKIINISSMSSFGIFPFVSPYCASKRAMDILFNALSLESNVKVVSVKPGVIATPLWEKSIENNKKSIENSDGYEKQMKYLIQNAKENGQKGLNVNKVRDLIIKIDSLKNPKVSYTIGKDALLASLVSKLSFDCQNKLIKFNMNRKFGK